MKTPTTLSEIAEQLAVASMSAENNRQSEWFDNLSKTVAKISKEINNKIGHWAEMSDEEIVELYNYRYKLWVNSYRGTTPPCPELTNAAADAKERIHMKKFRDSLKTVCNNGYIIGGEI
jgi:hypothetical protein